MLYEGRRYSWITGFYWTLTTMSTPGFGDITFVRDLGIIFPVIVLLSGIVFLLVMPFTFIQFFYAPWLAEQNKARAAMVVVFNDDFLSTNIIYTIRERCPDVVTVTNADREESLDILQLAGSTHALQVSRLRQIAGVTVVGLWEQGRFILPGPHSRIGESTVLVLAGTQEQLDRFDRSIGVDRADMPEKGPVLVLLGGGRR